MTADMKRIQQILLNLVSNSLKFTIKGQITIRSYPSFVEDRWVIVVSVKDSGIGMSRSD